MKKILMLTDFSKMRTTPQKPLESCPSTEGGYFAYHTYYDYPILPTYAGGPRVVEEFVSTKKARYMTTAVPY